MQTALIRSEKERFSGFTIGKVIKLYPEANMVDVMLFDGTVFKQVQVMVSTASSRSGTSGLPLPVQKNDQFRKDRPLATSRLNEGESDVFAVLGFVGGCNIRPLVFGFLFPEENELLCDVSQEGNEDGTMFLWKHESNVYFRVAKGSTKDKTPEIEISHPSGFFLKIGNSITRTTISNYDEKLRKFKCKNPDNDSNDPAPIVHLSHPSGTYLTIDAAGKVTVYAVGDMEKTVKGNLTETIEGNIDRTIKGNLVETVEGDETKTVEGTWLRQSDTEIEDKCGTIHHNK